MLMQKCAYCLGRGKLPCPACRRAQFAALKSEAAAAWLRESRVYVKLDKSVPDAACPHCGDKGEITCPGCMGSGFVEMPAWA